MKCLAQIVSSVLLTLAVAVPASADPGDAFLPDRARVDNRADFSQRLLYLHNRERARIGQPPLVWDARLADDAWDWADSLARRGVFEHSPAQLRVGEGENLWRGTAGAYTLEEMMGHFLSEKQDFQPGIFPDVARDGDWHEIGHYTQMIWPTTRAVGCAMTSQRGEDYLVCRFSPPGNVIGQSVP